MRKEALRSCSTDVFAQMEAVIREIAPIEAAFRENGGNLGESCSVCAHWSARKSKCAVLGVKYAEMTKKCSVFIPDPAKTGEKP